MSAITGFYVIDSGSNGQPPLGYQKIDKDLNSGPGNYLYLCYTKIEAVGPPITAIDVVTSLKKVPEGYTPVDVNLNKSVPGKSLYLCFTTSTTHLGHWTDVDVIVSKDEDERPPAGWELYGEDLNAGTNEGSGHYYVYICFKQTA